MRGGAATFGRRGRALTPLFALLIASCGSPPRETFDLSSEGLRGNRPIHGRAAIVVAEPDATAPTASDRIVIRTGGQAIAYLAGAQWADRLPKLAQARMIGALERGGVIAARPGEASGPVLTTEIRRFEIDEARQIAVVEIAARVAGPGGKTRAARVFLGEAPAPHTIGALATQALGDALDEVLRQLVPWARASGERRYEARGD